MFFMNPLYMLILIIGFALSAITSMAVRSAFRKGKKVTMANGLTGAEVAQKILDSQGIRDVEIVETRGLLTDHYNPMTKKLVLSRDVYNGRSASSAGVAAHEVGHAVQHANKYFPLWLRSAIVPVANIGSRFGLWITILGIILGVTRKSVESGAPSIGYYVALVGILMFAAATVFSIITVPVEINASRRAVKILDELAITRTDEESASIKRVLTAAALTYVAAAAISIMQLLYWIFVSGIFRRN